MTNMNSDLPTLRQHYTYLSDRRKVVLWSLRYDWANHRAPLLLGSGFGRRMDHFSSLALYLVNAGFVVFRYDSVDHDGLSDGQMENYTLSSGLVSLEAAIQWVCAQSGVNSIGVVVTSLSARVAYESIARTSGIAFLITIMGVVDVRRTLERVFGHDYTVLTPSALPDFVEFQRQRIQPGQFYSDYHEYGWGTAVETMDVLSTVIKPIVGFASEQDPWVDIATVREVFARGNGFRRLIEISDSGHQIGSNPSIARALFRRLTEIALELSGDALKESWSEPGFSQMAEEAIRERRIQRAVVDPSR
jgi:acyl transferase